MTVGCPACGKSSELDYMAFVPHWHPHRGACRRWRISRGAIPGPPRSSAHTASQNPTSTDRRLCRPEWFLYARSCRSVWRHRRSHVSASARHPDQFTILRGLVHTEVLLAKAPPSTRRATPSLTSTGSSQHVTPSGISMAYESVTKQMWLLPWLSTHGTDGRESRRRSAGCHFRLPNTAHHVRIP